MRKKINLIILSMLLCVLFAGCGSSVEYEPSDIPEEELEGKYYYNLTSDEEERVIYKQLLHGIREHKETIIVQTVGMIRTPEILDRVTLDFSDLIWFEGKCEYTEYEKGLFSPAYMKFEMDYTYSKEEAEQMLLEIEDAASKVLPILEEKESDYAKVKYAYEWIINNVDYVDDAPHNQNIYSTFVTNETVCAGYARGMQYLLENAGVECFYVTGEAVDSEGVMDEHAWNIVKINDNNYIVDATWGDPVFESEEETERDNLRPISYEYLCCDDSEIEDTHTLKSMLLQPVCDSDDLQYYKKNGMFYTSYDKSDILDAMYESIRDGKEYTVFQFEDKESYDKAFKAIKNDLIETAAYYMIDYYSLPEVWTGYETYSNSIKIIVYIYEK